MTSRKNKAPIYGVPASDRLRPDWYEKDYLKWAIRKAPRWRSYWSTAARVLDHLKPPVTADDAMRFEVQQLILPDPEADTPDASAFHSRVSYRLPHDPAPTPEFVRDLERLAIAAGVGMMEPRHYAAHGAAFGLALPGPEEMEPLRLALVGQVEPILREQMRADPAVPRPQRPRRRVSEGG